MVGTHILDGALAWVGTVVGIRAMVLDGRIITTVSTILFGDTTIGTLHTITFTTRGHIIRGDTTLGVTIRGVDITDTTIGTDGTGHTIT